MKRMNTELVFLLRGGREEHRAFREQFKIRPRILIDDDGQVGEMLGIYEPHCEIADRYKYYMAPAVFVVNSDGKMGCWWILSGPRGRPSAESILGILAYAQGNDWKY